MKDGKFEVGDRVKNIRMDSTFFGQIGTVININGEEVGVEYDSSNSDYELIKPATKSLTTITINSTKYQILKEISGKSIWDNGKYSGCGEWCEQFDYYLKQFGFQAWPEDQLLAIVDGYFKKFPTHLQWLINNKYLQKVEKKMVKKSIIISNSKFKSIQHTVAADAFDGNFFGNVSYDEYKKLSNVVGFKRMNVIIEWEEEE
jgi:hypothetical protein